MSFTQKLLISLGILLAGGAVTALIFFTEPTASRGGAVRETAMLVDVTDVERGSFTPTIRAMGTVQPSQDITLSPRVSGPIIRRSESFAPGGYIQAGDTLLQIDPADYRNTLQQRQSDLRQALSDLTIEQGRQDVARQDYQLLADTLQLQNEALVLREPQLESVQARVEAARAAVDQAELNLRRTTITAPFDAHVLARNVNVGSQVSPGDNLGRLVGMDTYWVEVTVPLSQLRWLTIPRQEHEEGSPVVIRNSSWEEGEYRRGRLFKLVGALEDGSRLARVLVSVPDPHAYRRENSDVPSLIIGSFVETMIEGEEISNVIRLNRDYVRQNDTVWVMEERRLRIRDVDIVFRDANYAYISGGLDAGAQVVTTNLSTVADGARLRLEGSDTAPGEPITPEPAP